MSIHWAQSPLLLGYNATKPKQTVEVLLATERDQPHFHGVIRFAEDDRQISGLSKKKRASTAAHNGECMR